MNIWTTSGLFGLVFFGWVLIVAAAYRSGATPKGDYTIGPTLKRFIARAMTVSKWVIAVSLVAILVGLIIQLVS